MNDLDLEAYESAYDRVERQLQLDRDWGDLERRMRRRLSAPSWRLAQTLAFIGLAAVVAIYGRWHTWGVVIGTILAVLPRRRKDLRMRRQELAAVETAEDVRALCKGEADRAFASSVAKLILSLGFTVLFAAFAVLLALFDKLPWASAAAAAAMLVRAAVLFFVVMPRQAREAAVYESPDDADDDDDDDVD